MRIIGGIYKGRVLYGFDGFDIRPTSDRTRESLFNILQSRIVGANFLDLFCGTGAVGIEALSRGANRVVFNDKDKTSLELTKANLKKINATENFATNLGDGACYLTQAKETFDIVFIDPPYKGDLGELALNQVVGVLNPNGIAILESEQPFSSEVEGLIKYDQRKYGRAYLTFFKRED